MQFVMDVPAEDKLISAEDKLMQHLFTGYVCSIPIIPEFNFSQVLSKLFETKVPWILKSGSHIPKKIFHLIQLKPFKIN